MYVCMYVCLYVCISMYIYMYAFKLILFVSKHNIYSWLNIFSPGERNQKYRELKKREETMQGELL